MSLLRNRWLRILCFAIGTSLLIYFMHALGWPTIAHYLTKIGWAWPPLLLISLSWYIFNCLAWEQFLINRRDKLSFAKLFRIKIAGETINTVTPVSWIGGDPLRIALMRPFLETTHGAASVILDRTIHSLTAVVLMGIGLAIALFVLPLPDSLSWGLFGVMVAMTLTLLAIMRHQHRGILGSLLFLLDRTGLGRWVNDMQRGKVISTDEQIRHFYHMRKWRFGLAMVYHLSGRLLGIFEIYMIATLLNAPLSFLNAYFLAMLTALINFIFVVIPGGLGVMEGAYGGMFHLISLDPAAGIAVQLVRRIRTFFWIGMGFAIMSFTLERSPSSIPADAEDMPLFYE